MGIIDPRLESILKSKKFDSLPVKIAVDPRYCHAEIEVSFKPKKPVTQKTFPKITGLQQLTEELEKQNKGYRSFKETLNSEFQEYIVTELTPEEITVLVREPYVYAIYDELPRDRFPTIH